MGALGYWLEEEGVATTQISLIREHTEAIKPPRALWVPFIMGRPLGVPGDAAFQRRVMLAALRLLEMRSGPILEDYDEDAPQPAAAELEGLACAVSFSRQPGEQGLAEDLQREIGELAPWHDLARQRGRSIATLSGLTAEAAGRFLTDFIDDPQTPVYRDTLSLEVALRLACQDLKAHYLKAVTAQPGAQAAIQAQQWLWHDTALGRVFFELRDACMANSDQMVRTFGGKGLVPLAIAPRPSEWT